MWARRFGSSAATNCGRNATKTIESFGFRSKPELTNRAGEKMLAPMRTIVCTIVLAAAAAALPAKGSAAAGCGPKVVFLVWPHGHPALAKIGFPNIPNPHVEVYLGFGDEWPDSRAGGYIIGGKPPAAFPQGGAFGACLNYGAAAPASAKVAGGSTISTQTAVECTFGRSAVIDIVDRPGKVQILLFHAGKKLLARADASPTGASVTLPKKGCRKVPSPG
jgi:hypothetical protein